ncbi:MAG: hypothetical protein QM528_09055 [Phycisphaerales bacterium]|nr:hypothetical protein [Phycisphaerales bacterium]
MNNLNAQSSYGVGHSCNRKHTKAQKILVVICKALVIIILIQTLWFKFGGMPESKYIFTQLHAEPFGRISSGLVELIASILILIPAYTVYGAILALGTMSGAILSHLFVLGTVLPQINSSGMALTLPGQTYLTNPENFEFHIGPFGSLFILACITFVCCLYLLWINRCQIFDLFSLGKKQKP